MKKHFIIFLFLVYSITGFSQFADDFSDGNFTNNPIWLGNIENFEVDTSFKLRLNDSITNTSYLSTSSQAIINGSWEFEIKLDFDPSTSNYAKVYLTSDEQDLSGDLNGYFVKIGGESGAVDDVSLYAQNGTSTTKIINGLRDILPSTLLIGWKYEAEGTPESVRIKGKNQMELCKTDGCVLNGPAYGTGYGLLRENLFHCNSEHELFTHLITLLR